MTGPVPRSSSHSHISRPSRPLSATGSADGGVASMRRRATLQSCTFPGVGSRVQLTKTRGGPCDRGRRGARCCVRLRCGRYHGGMGAKPPLFRRRRSDEQPVGRILSTCRSAEDTFPYSALGAADERLQSVLFGPWISAQSARRPPKCSALGLAKAFSMGFMSGLQGGR